MAILAKNLTEKDQEIFVDFFYDVAPLDIDDDLETPMPWGCPWLWDKNASLHGETLKEMAKNFYEENKEKIVELMEEDYAEKYKIMGPVLEYDQKKVFLTQEAFISDDGKFFISYGIDIYGQEYEINFPIYSHLLRLIEEDRADELPSDEADYCDWENNYTIKKYN